jgi:murein DD-endopeptidase MepM/ murein hydrolase activator NlpD
MRNLRNPWIACSLVVLLALPGGCGGGSGGNGGGPGGRAACAGPYPNQATSLYVLPYDVGETFVVGQGNCGSSSHAAGTLALYAYDFLMPIGTTIIAARSGQVILVEERFTDGNRMPGQENYINIRHSDGTLAGYVHLTQNGALVSVGDMVTQGDVIGLSGDTGSSTQPHLHFHVQQASGLPTIPITFRNTRAHPQGLLQGQSYLADPFTPMP